MCNPSNFPILLSATLEKNCFIISRLQYKCINDDFFLITSFYHLLLSLAFHIFNTEQFLLEHNLKSIFFGSHARVVKQ